MQTASMVFLPALPRPLAQPPSLAFTLLADASQFDVIAAHNAGRKESE